MSGTRWEYREWLVPTHLTSRARFLNEFGLEGWELVCIESEAFNAVRLTFKRPLVGEGDGS